MSRSSLPAASIVIGFVLVVGSWIWPSLVGGRQAWSESDAEQFQIASAQFHDLTYQYGAAIQQAEQSTNASNRPMANSESNLPSTALDGRYSEVKKLADRLAQVKDRYEGLSAKLNSAQSAGQSAANIMRWIGIAAIAVGALGYYADRANANNRS